MIEPTDALRGVLNTHKCKGIFFVDILGLLNFEKQPELTTELLAVKKQLKTLFSEGHFVFPHIHAHWLDAKFIDEEKQFDLSDLRKYSLSTLNAQQVNELFFQSISFLKSLDINYSSWGYRAGGWCMQPFSAHRESFLKQNIRYDFSVLPGYKNENPEQAFDYTNVTTHEPYYFEFEVERPDQKGHFVEFPISTVSMSPFVKFKDRLLGKYLWRIGDRGWGDGISAQTPALKTPANNQMISLDVFNAAKLNTYFHFLGKNDFMHWISHPKMFTRHGLKTFDTFLRKCNSLYEIEFDFRNMIPSNK